jgi:hypothetical protein
MAMWLRQSTAAQRILLGIFLDSTDGNTEKTALSIANTDIKLWKEGANTEAGKNSGGATHIANGRYYTVLDASDTDTPGKLEVNVHVSGALAVRREYMVLPPNVYDALVLGSDYLDVSAMQLAGQTVTATAGVTFPSSVASPTNITSGTITTVTNLTNLPAITSGWITAAGIAANALNGKGDWNVGKTGYSLTQGFPSNFSSMAITTGGLLDISQPAADKIWGTTTRVLTAGTNIALAKGMGITGFNDLDADGVAGAVWNEAIPGAYGSGTAGKIVGDNLNATISSRASQASVDTAAGYIDDIQTRLPVALVGGRLDSNLSAIGNPTSALAAFKQAVKGNVMGTVGAGSTTISIIIASLAPAGSVPDQFKGRLITFSDDTTTAALRGQSTDITASTASATPTLTVTPLTTAAVAGDTFSIT